MYDVSVIIATWNRRESVLRLVNELDHCKCATARCEIIVVDNGSSDGTYEALCEIAARREDLKVLSQPIRGKNRALNLAVRHAQGELLIFTDDDVAPSGDWIANMHSASLRWPLNVVFGGKIVPVFPPNMPGWLKPEEFRYAAMAFSLYAPSDREKRVPTPPFGANLAIRRQVFDTYNYCESIGPAGPTYAMGSETELLIRLRSAGFDFVYVPTASVGHIVRENQLATAWLLRRAFSAGRGEMRMLPAERVTWFGVPRWLVRQCVTSMMSFMLSGFSSKGERLSRLMMLWRRAGAIYEARKIARELRGDIESLGSHVMDRKAAS